MKIYLIGLPTVGKSRLGKIIAKELKISFYDLDEIITNLNRLSPKEIINNYGEAYFRKLETIALKSITNPNCIVSCGGGVVVSAENKALMSGLVIYLKAKPKDLIVTYSQLEDRPILKEKGLEQIYQERKRLYQNFSDLTINLKGKTDDEIIRKVLKAYEKHLNH